MTRGIVPVSDPFQYLYGSIVPAANRPAISANRRVWPIVKSVSPTTNVVSYAYDPEFATKIGEADYVVEGWDVLPFRIVNIPRAAGDAAALTLDNN